MIRIAVSELERLISTKNVVGEPVAMGDRVMIPISGYGFGFGGGSGKGNAGEGQAGAGGEGSGVGAAAGVTPIAVVVLDGTVSGPTGVQVHLLKKRSEMAEVVGTLSSSLVPQVIDALKCKQGGSDASSAEECCEPAPSASSSTV
ncbi:MAG: spore germination protein GerW family protein [Methanospirillum sp.]